jgi:hypothetical protein
MYRSNYIILIDQIWDVQRSTRKQKLSPCCGASWQLLDHGELLSGTDHGNLVLPAIEGGSQKHVLTSVGKSFEKNDDLMKEIHGNTTSSQDGFLTISDLTTSSHSIVI